MLLSRTHKVGPEEAYWVCAYANNQFALGDDLGTDPKKSSFFKAMAKCRGVLLVALGKAEVATGRVEATERRFTCATCNQVVRRSHHLYTRWLPYLATHHMP